eukprot:1720829-Prymnesium_polylepis.1
MRSPVPVRERPGAAELRRSANKGSARSRCGDVARNVLANANTVWRGRRCAGDAQPADGAPNQGGAGRHDRPARQGVLGGEHRVLEGGASSVDSRPPAAAFLRSPRRTPRGEGAPPRGEGAPPRSRRSRAARQSGAGRLAAVVIAPLAQV